MWQVSAADGEAVPLSAGAGAQFPGPADPRGTHALILAVEDDASMHRETAWLAPLAGGDPIRLTPGAGRIRSPVWSPDGALLVFESDATSFRDLYRVARDGTDLRRLTECDQGCFEPTVSADGRHVVFTASGDDVELHRVAVDGTGRRALTDSPYDELSPAHAPTGDRIAWLRRDRVWIRGEGGERPLLPADHGRQAAFAWAPDGEHLAVVVEASPRNLDIHVVAVDGDVVARYGDDAVDEHPTWSPDGEWIAWTRGQGPEADVVAVRVGGRWPVRPITTTPGPDWLPRWLPAPP